MLPRSGIERSKDLTIDVHFAVDIWQQSEHNTYMEGTQNKKTTLATIKYLYTPQYRPPSFNCLPKGWGLVERPAATPNNFERRTDLPVSQHPFGVVSFHAELTEDQLADYQLKVV